jgi:hypothetical protein
MVVKHVTDVQDGVINSEFTGNMTVVLHTVGLFQTIPSTAHEFIQYRHGTVKLWYVFL